MEEVVRPVGAAGSGTVDTEAMVAAVVSGLSIADTPDLEPNDRAFLKHLRRAIQTSGPRLPPMPEAVVRIDRVLRKPSCSVTEVADVVRADAAVATKLLGIANSPFYAGLGRVRSVEGAITRMGLRETKSIVQAIALGSRLLRVRGHEAEIERLYHHTLASALAAGAIASRVQMDPDEAFLAGLIHDIGRSVLLTAVGDFERTHGRKQGPSKALIERLLDALHEDLSALVARAWRTGPEIEVAVRFHESPEHAPECDGKRLAHLLALADDVARYTLDADLAASPLDDVIRLRLADHLGLTTIDPILDEVRSASMAFELPLAPRSEFALPEVVAAVSISPDRTAHPD
jgi:HD-like signal output (HDOD) protein